MITLNWNHHCHCCSILECQNKLNECRSSSFVLVSMAIPGFWTTGRTACRTFMLLARGDWVYLCEGSSHSGQGHILFSHLCDDIFDMLLKQEIRTYADSDSGRVAHLKSQLSKRITCICGYIILKILRRFMPIWGQNHLILMHHLR